MVNSPLMSWSSLPRWIIALLLYGVKARPREDGQQSHRWEATPLLYRDNLVGARGFEPRTPAPKAGALPGCATPRLCQHHHSTGKVFSCCARDSDSTLTAREVYPKPIEAHQF